MPLAIDWKLDLQFPHDCHCLIYCCLFNWLFVCCVCSNKPQFSATSKLFTTNGFSLYNNQWNDFFSKNHTIFPCHAFHGAFSWDFHFTVAFSLLFWFGCVLPPKCSINIDTSRLVSFKVFEWKWKWVLIGGAKKIQITYFVPLATLCLCCIRIYVVFILGDCCR